MATGTIPLAINAASPPDGSASNLAPAIVRRKSSAAAPTPYWFEAWFDASQTEQLMWSFKLPSNYASGPLLKVTYKMASATSGDVKIEGRLAATTPNTDTADADAKGFGTSNTATETVPTTTAGKMSTLSITLTNADSVAANDFVIVYLARLGADGSDTAAGDMEVVTASFEYTTT